MAPSVIHLYMLRRSPSAREAQSSVSAFQVRSCSYPRQRHSHTPISTTLVSGATAAVAEVERYLSRVVNPLATQRLAKQFQDHVHTNDAAPRLRVAVAVVREQRGKRSLQK